MAQRFAKHEDENAENQRSSPTPAPTGVGGSILWEVIKDRLFGGGGSEAASAETLPPFSWTPEGAAGVAEEDLLGLPEFSWTPEAGEAQLPTQLDPMAGQSGGPIGPGFPLSEGAALALATIAGNEAMDAYGGQAGQAGYSAINALNPLNAAWEAGEALPGLADGGDLPLSAQAALAIPTAGLSFLYNPVKDAFGSGKDPDQKQRDQIRGNLRDTGFVNEDNQFTFPAGETFDFGDEDMEDVRVPQRTYDVDLEDPLAQEAVVLINPLSALITGEEGTKAQTDLAGMLANSVLQGRNASPLAVLGRAVALYQHYGLSPEEVLEGLKEMSEKGTISRDFYAASVEGINRLINPETESGARGGRLGSFDVMRRKPMFAEKK